MNRKIKFLIAYFIVGFLFPIVLLGLFLGKISTDLEEWARK